MYGKNCDIRVGTLQFSQPVGNYIVNGFLNYDSGAPADGNVNFDATSNSKWFFKQDGSGSLRNFDWMANPTYPAIGINPQNWYGGNSEDTSFNSSCLAIDNQCLATTSLYSTSGKIPDTDGQWKSNSFDQTQLPNQCFPEDGDAGSCYPTLIGSAQNNSIVTAWAGPRYPSGPNDYEYDWPQNTAVTWVDVPLSPAETQRAMQL
jgi:hypothetical protein